MDIITPNPPPPQKKDIQGPSESSVHWTVFADPEFTVSLQEVRKDLPVGPGAACTALLVELSEARPSYALLAGSR